MNLLYENILLHLLTALVAGGLIGLERSYHGRPAGFRTHVLVCVSSSMLMLVTLYQSSWYIAPLADTVRTDPTRMAQGIMTGIGFLGAGVIMKDGLSVRGLTTAASIWMTAAIGILAGIGFYFPVFVVTTLTVAALSIFRWLERILPSYYYAHHVVRFSCAGVMDEEALRELIAAHGFTIANMSYSMEDSGRIFEYRMVIRSRDRDNATRLAQTWHRANGSVLGFRIEPA
ncbi:MgtC/SapB family protein|uniref:MgtC/SapB family protein n=1 Tax=Noviherbaspirillum sp. L7-7A TaxID=2850560 RepID=UPI001C2C0043|nr:MgtC/SapB family protein [Noviherbaspirillum sp. L7-7A]MBV0878365.1 MgtC/SapB family protein [Noviherbaspirillum sp. L7-7A]